MTGLSLCGIMCGVMKSDRYALLERLVRIEGGLDPRSGRRVMPRDLWEALIEDEMRDLYGPVRHEPWDKLEWCGVDELPEDMGNINDEPSISCGLFCMAKSDDLMDD